MGYIANGNAPTTSKILLYMETRISKFIRISKKTPEIKFTISMLCFFFRQVNQTPKVTLQEKSRKAKLQGITTLKNWCWDSSCEIYYFARGEGSEGIDVYVFILKFYL